ncbi:DUF4129 domain-containing protein [Thiothrix nivea]|uniref:Protein-glutamine gamma-glutamyltransferase-like C-terminal domain-containing protein n=1 Tax=Thiothrix nivea (strain ATCC 35100 / DSM 5205 / JP2) TaxID=870187 RepID=A0A656HB59_THINJ|nr:DUF4129 domain-containing protein [Thiothrix nivea]EIJ33154.1 hypothetical protein Thini_0516 [Thiothrix nivea DSM 5205]
MKLDDITANIRLRSPWEAVDLGFALVQHNARWIFPAWSVVLLSVALLAWVLTPADYHNFAPLVVWWFKPLYDRVLLHILSHQMFNQHLATAEIFNAIPGLLRNSGLFSALTWRRFSLSRGFNLPIWQLEQLRGKPRKERQNLLHLQTHTQAVWLMVACVHLEYVLMFSLYALIIIFDPTDGAWNYILSSFIDPLDRDAQYWGNLIYLLLYTLTVWVVEPLYLAASFSLYLNRRTQLEAWDIELAFRSLGERLGKLERTLPILLLILGLGIFLIHPAPALAVAKTESEYLSPQRLPAGESAKQINEVMQVEELSSVYTRKAWMPRQQPEMGQEPTAEWLESLQVLFAGFLKILLWIALVALTFSAFFHRQRIFALLKPVRRKLPGTAPPDILFGMDIRPESLPDDIAATSRHLWENGQPREALSLLYRGALMRLTRHDRLPVQASHTEGDILQLARGHLGGERMAWLATVTHAWQEIAYAHRPPANALAESLFDGWSQHFTAPPMMDEVAA